VNGAVGPSRDVSIKITSSQPIVAERPIYFNYKGIWNGGHNTIGATAAATTWDFAEGYTGEGFEEWLTLQNPNGEPAYVNVTYMFRGGGTQVQELVVGANSRETVDVNGTVGAGKE
jgi:hypothetical protein